MGERGKVTERRKQERSEDLRGVLGPGRMRICDPMNVMSKCKFFSSLSGFSTPFPMIWRVENVTSKLKIPAVSVTDKVTLGSLNLFLHVYCGG